MQRKQLHNNLMVWLAVISWFSTILQHEVDAMPEGVVLGFKPCDPEQNDPMCHVVGQFGSRCSDMYPCARGLYCKRRYFFFNLLFYECLPRIPSSIRNGLLSMRALPSLRNTYKGARGISSDRKFSPSKAS